MLKKNVLLVSSVSLALLIGLIGMAVVKAQVKEEGEQKSAVLSQPPVPTPTPSLPEVVVKNNEVGSTSALQPVNPPPLPTPTPGGPTESGPVPLGIVAYESTLSKVNNNVLHVHSRTAYPDAKGVRADCPILWWNANAGRWDEVGRGADFIDSWDDDESADFDRTFYQVGWFIQVCEHRSSENNGQTWIFRYGPNYSQQVYLP